MVEQDAARRIARASGLTRRELDRYLELRVVALPAADAEALGRRLRRLHRLRRDLGLDVETAALVARLLDRIEMLERSRL